MNGQAWNTMETGPEQASFGAMDDLINFDPLDLDLSADFNYNGGDFSQGGDGALHDFTQAPHFQHNGGQQHNMAPYDYSMGQFSQAGTPVFPQAQEHMFQPHHGVPPTPNSVEMHGDPNRYMQQQLDQQALFDQRYHMRKDDASFTPLVSPAVTPHDGRFQIPDFSVPGAFSFSPLTSPALTAQNHQHAHQQSQHTTSGSSTGHSPIDVDMENAANQEETGRRLRSTNRRSAPRSANATTRVRQSPIVKPGRRKATVSTLIPPKEVSDLIEETTRGRGGLDALYSRTGSETDSISPEPMLSEMRPPPKPASMTQSPAMMAQMNGQGATPATPASLMRIHPSPSFSDTMEPPSMMEDLTLPEASLDRPALVRIDTAIHEGDQDTPRMSARKTPKMGPLSTPGASMGNRPSPMIEPATTPTSPAFSMTNGKKGDSKFARVAKKRNSTCSTMASPALMPKISPSIKPLLPEGANRTDNTHALLLASKSNYQNILDGTTVPGVVYPTSLSTNLTSKRTSHKIAEQGRRNRINMALQEMQALLPTPLNAAAEDKSPETAAQSSNSKAAKVESAIDYIKQLKQEVSERDKLIESKDQEMEQLRKELAALRRSSSVGSAMEDSAQLKSEPVSTPSTDGST